jgi:hypothetical protein
MKIFTHMIVSWHLLSFLSHFIIDRESVLSDSNPSTPKPKPSPGPQTPVNSSRTNLRESGPTLTTTPQQRSTRVAGERQNLSVLLYRDAAQTLPHPQSLWMVVTTRIYTTLASSWSLTAPQRRATREVVRPIRSSRTYTLACRL